MDDLALIPYALVGTLLGSLVACVPALHVYNVAGLVVLFYARLEGLISPQRLAPLFTGMLVGYAVLNAIPSVFFGTPDESVVWLVLPGQRYLMRRRGYEAVVLSGIGSLGGLLVVVLLAPFAGQALSWLRPIVEPHVHWLLGAIVLYLLASEWPKGTGRGRTAWSRLWDGWQSLVAGLATFILAGVLGLVLTYRPLIAPEVSFQDLMPAFVGLFAVPWLVQSLLSGAPVPRQHLSSSVDVTPGLIARGVGAGAVGGMLAAFFPAVTAGIGGLVAGHATAQRDDRVFIISQGTCKTLYYVGAFLLFFVPGSGLTRGGMAWMLSPFYTPHTPREYWLATAVVAFCGTLAFSMLLLLSRLAASLVSCVDHRHLSVGILALLLALIAGLTGWRGVLIAIPATGIGLLPLVFHSRRVNCMGLLLVPILIDMAGLGAGAAQWLGLG
jgi:putative membrane protein